MSAVYLSPNITSKPALSVPVVRGECIESHTIVLGFDPLGNAQNDEQQKNRFLSCYFVCKWKVYVILIF